MRCLVKQASKSSTETEKRNYATNRGFLPCELSEPDHTDEFGQQDKLHQARPEDAQIVLTDQHGCEDREVLFKKRLSGSRTGEHRRRLMRMWEQQGTYEMRREDGFSAVCNLIWLIDRRIMYSEPPLASFTYSSAILAIEDIAEQALYLR